MLNKTLEDSSVIKLKQILASRYGKSLEIRQLYDLSKSKTGPFVKGDSYYIPLVCENVDLGVAVVADAQNLKEADRDQVAQMVKMILEPTMYSWYLDRKEHNLQEIIRAQSEVEESRSERVTITESDEFEEITFEQSPQGQLLSNLIHLIGSNEQVLKKVALQIHEMTQRWAFVPFKDISASLHSTADITKLGAMTLLIEDIEQLNPHEQTLILEFLEMPQQDEYPLFITCSSKSIKELEASPLVSSQLVDEASVSALEIDRLPLSSSALKEVLELFFFKVDTDFYT